MPLVLLDMVLVLHLMVHGWQVLPTLAVMETLQALILMQLPTMDLSMFVYKIQIVLLNLI